MRVHITGGSGFLGNYVIQELLRRGHAVSGLARSRTAEGRLQQLGVEPIRGDLDDPPSIEAAFRQSNAEALVNVASLGFGHAHAIVTAANGANLRRGVFVSTTAIFTTLNAKSKVVRTAAEDTIKHSGLDWTIIRPTMIYGDTGDRNIARLLKVLKRTAALPIPGGGQRLQQPVHVADVAAAIATALERPKAIGKAYNVAGPEPMTFRELIEQAGEAVGRRPRLVPIPLGPTIAAVRLYERLAPNPRIKSEQLERLAEDKAFDITLAKKDLGYAPRPFIEGIRQETALLT